MIAVVWMCALAGALLTFPSFRTVGTSLIASAGLLSIVAGLAVQSSLSNIFAGMQIAFSDALRVGDLVVFNEQTGSVEEITLTYVVVRTWDDRRWIVPSSHFTTQPFENWTRREPRLLGTVEFDLDWLAPVEAMRVELVRLVRASDLWDGRSAALQVTESTGGHVRLRAVVSAATSGELWDLRCYVREEMIHWVQEHAVYALPAPASSRRRRPPLLRGARGLRRARRRRVGEGTGGRGHPADAGPEADDDLDEGALPKWLQSWLGQRRKPGETRPEQATPPRRPCRRRARRRASTPAHRRPRNATARCPARARPTWRSGSARRSGDSARASCPHRRRADGPAEGAAGQKEGLRATRIIPRVED
nr:mechanosensitive ion channel domain-containing protein [Tessaracoccus coleopterorum]